MEKSFQRYKQDLDKLIKNGDALFLSIQYECLPDQFKGALEKLSEEDKKKTLDKLTSFRSNYQNWYSESLVLLKQTLPDRTEDFCSYYKKDSKRKEINNSNYVIEDYLQGTHITRTYSGETIVGPSAAISKFQQQLNIIKSIQNRFESSLFDIKQLLQADLFDSELEASKELCKKGFLRGAGAMVGVVLESHFHNVCESHDIKTGKKHPTISDYNDLLKQEKVIEIDIFRFIQRLGDLRNKCDHKKTVEPTKEDINELIDGVDRITKTVF